MDQSVSQVPGSSTKSHEIQSGAKAEQLAAASAPSPGRSANVTSGEQQSFPVSNGHASDFEVPPAKRVKTENGNGATASEDSRIRKGVAPVKAEYLLSKEEQSSSQPFARDDDAAEAAGHDVRADKGHGKDGKKNKPKGQNTGRKFGSSRDSIQLCSTRVLSNEFSPLPCKFGDKCRFEHDIRKYLAEGRRGNLDTFGGICPVWNARGVCNAGWKCRFVNSHSQEEDTQDGRKELILTEDPERKARCGYEGVKHDEIGVVNVVSVDAKIALSKRRTKTPKADAYTAWLNRETEVSVERNSQKKSNTKDKDVDMDKRNSSSEDEKQENRALYKEPPFLPSEKRRLYYGPETPVLAPLTTQGNLPFRRLCVGLGAQITWSEMAMGIPLIQGEKSEWALLKAHESESRPPDVQTKFPVVQGYDNSKDLKFGAQIAANKPWIALKTTEVLTAHCPKLRAIDLNCGCPIDLVFRQGSGSALLDQASKLEKMLRGMNAVSNDIPITVKIRMGTKDGAPNADKLVRRLVLGGEDANAAGLGPCGIAAVTLHGRSRQQRYTRQADWKYISEVATLIKNMQKDGDKLADTVREVDARHLANGGKVYFVGNGDCYSHADYYEHMDEHQVDSVMVARGALIKPWIFEEIASQQYLDKSATERLQYIEQFARYGLEAWGSDEIGVGNTRRFLLEWLSFSCRYVPLGILERLPPNIQERPPRFRGRNELETLLASENYKDWIKISEMFLGPAHPDFRFEPKHKSNSYEMEAEG